MIDPDHRSAYARSRWTSGRGRAAVVAGGALAIVLAAAGLAFVLGGGLGAGALPGASTPAGGIVTPAPTVTPATATAEATSSADGSASPAGPTETTPAASPTPDGGAKVAVQARRIRIERLGIDLPIIEGDGIDAPIGKAAHFPSSGWPDGGTNIYIYGHARDGMFITLWDARKGDVVVLGLVDGTSRSYVVTEVLPKVPWDAVEYLEPTPAEQLTLQTSTSYYPTAPRFVVIAVPRP